MTARCALNPDRMIYFVLCCYDTGIAWAERDIGRTNEADTLDDIRTGELPNVVQVIEINLDPAERICRDVTEDMLRESGRLEIDAPSLSPSERLIAFKDHARDLRKNWSA